MRISIIVPCRDGAAFLGPALDSALNQTLPPAEVIVVDDGSTDASREVAQSFGAAVSLLTGTGRGAAAARRLGADRATGDALLFLDADDLLGPTALEHLAAALVDVPDGIARCPWLRLDPWQCGWVVAPASCAPRRRGQDDIAAWLTGWYHPPCALLWSRAAYERSGGWDPAIGVNDDGDLMLRALTAGCRLVPTDGGVAYYRRTGPASLSAHRGTPEGIASRRAVLDRVAARLSEQGRLHRYRRELAAAYRAIADQSARPVAEGTGPTAPDPPTWDVGGADNLVTVIIPTFNRAALLPRAIDSVLAQTWTNLELLVVDDGSTDGTAELVRSYTDSRVRLLRQPVNAGVAAARNRGLVAARGGHIAFLDSDDAWLPEKLARQLAVFATGPRRLGLVYTGVETLDGRGGRSVLAATAAGDIHRDMLVANRIHGGGSNVLLKRAAVRMAGLFDPTLPAAEDHDYWLRVTRFWEVAGVPAPLIRYFDEADDPARADRRSRDFAANMAARRMLHAKHGHEMRAQGVEHLFLLDSARRQLDSPFGSAAAARRLVLGAIRRRPLAREPWRWLLPWRLRRVWETTGA